MPRRRSVEFIREIGVDPKFGSALIQKLINVVMERGKKNCARTIVYEAMDLLVKKTNGDEFKLQLKATAKTDESFPGIMTARTSSGTVTVKMVCERVERRYY